MVLVVKKDKQNNNKQTKKNQGKNKQIKMGIIVPTMNHYKKEILNSPPGKFLIPVYKVYLYATLPPSEFYRL